MSRSCSVVTCGEHGICQHNIPRKPTVSQVLHDNQSNDHSTTLDQNNESDKIACEALTVDVELKTYSVTGAMSSSNIVPSTTRYNNKFRHVAWQS